MKTSLQIYFHIIISHKNISVEKTNAIEKQSTLWKRTYWRYTEEIRRGSPDNLNKIPVHPSAVITNLHMVASLKAYLKTTVPLAIS